MYLERIEISGFKSFADKTVIAFDKGVTAIVGPNGSGKSNLSEAIKWVLGEQSAKSLRGKKMDDIIFAGSQTRKAVNVAEVTLVLNNEDGFLPLDFSEIQITRRMNRNGESECFINKKPCRLKDIVHLFMDSGLGKDSFSIISQGKVETIFHNKPEERRGMIEEVAGVLKYKTRKQEASRKLERTQDNLDRVEDILFEIEKQLKPLAQQKEKALLYQEKKQALSRVEIALLVAEIDTASQQMTIVQTELVNLRQTLQTNRYDSQQNDEALTKEKVELNRLEMVLSRLQEEYVVLVQQLEKVTGEHTLAKERLAFSMQTKEQQAFAHFEKEQEYAQLQQEHGELVRLQKERINAVKTLVQQFNVLKKEEELLQTDSAELVEEKRHVYIDMLQEHTKCANSVLSFEKEMQRLVVQKERLSGQLDTFVQKVSNLEKQREQFAQDVVHARKNVEKVTQTYVLQQESLQATSRLLEIAKKTLQEKTTVLTQLEAKKHSLQDLDDDFAGYYQGVRAILKEKTLQGVHGSIAQLIEVPKQYTLALDIALGASLQHIVVSDEKSAKNAITYLTQKRLGRATFLPISVIQSRTLSQDILTKCRRQVGFIGMADELVVTNNTYKNIVSNLLGQTIVADTIDNGTNLAKGIGYRYRVVTLSGEVIHAGGSMTGGATNQKGQSLLSRTSQIKELTESIKRLKSEKQVLLNEVAQLEETALNEQDQLRHLQQQGAQARLVERECELTLERHQHELAQIHQQVEVLTKEKATLDGEIRDVEQQLQLANAKTTQTKELLEQAKIDLDHLTISQDDKIAQLAILQPKIQDVSSRLAVAKEQEHVATVNLKQLDERLSTMQMSLDVLKIQQVEIVDNSESIAREIEQTKALIETLSENKIALELKINQTKDNKKHLDVTIRDKEEKQHALQDVLQHLLKDEGTLQARLERYDVTVDTHIARLSQEYELTYEAAKVMEALDMRVSDAVSYVSRIKREIEQLGPVNMTAIQEYDDVFSRFTEMTTQKEDLIVAKEQLLATMLDMDEEVEKRFKSTFFAIKSEFEKTFPKLFGGGRATLELTDPTNLLESGIDIIAQPPGKRLQNLSLLSGGEKAFTAIALLFAILQVKPVPFCLLDEVEAALDEANVGRYGRYLKTFVEQTQFIVITHRKGTMEEADVLYGVTMQESGVSKLASVKLQEYSDEDVV